MSRPEEVRAPGSSSTKWGTMRSIDTILAAERARRILNNAASLACAGLLQPALDVLSGVRAIIQPYGDTSEATYYMEQAREHNSGRLFMYALFHYSRIVYTTELGAINYKIEGAANDDGCPVTKRRIATAIQRNNVTPLPERRLLAGYEASGVYSNLQACTPDTPLGFTVEDLTRYA